MLYPIVAMDTIYSDCTSRSVECITVAKALMRAPEGTLGPRIAN